MKNTLNYLYKFAFADGITKEFLVKLDPLTLHIIPSQKAELPDWTLLRHFQCPNCTLDREKIRYCPIAVNIVDVINFFKGSLSFEKVTVTITTEARNYSKEASLQEALSSLLGLYMAVSGCPVMDKLRPMVVTHIPFAKLHETVYRVITMYLLAQYFLYKKGKVPDWDLKNLSQIYKDVRLVNKSFSQRILLAIEKDASANAIVILDCFAIATTMAIDKLQIKKLESIFGAYFDQT